MLWRALTETLSMRLVYTTSLGPGSLHVLDRIESLLTFQAQGSVSYMNSFLLVVLSKRVPLSKYHE